MIKRWFFNAILLLSLSGLVAVYLFVASDLQGEIYTPEQQEALVVHSRLNLIQNAPVWNVYVSEADTGNPTLGATLGAADCRVRATLDARYEDLEGITTTVYDLDFDGTYILRYSGLAPTTTLELIFPFPEGLDTLNQVYFEVADEEGKYEQPAGVQYSLGNITWRTEVNAHEEQRVRVRYRARGVGSFHYALEHDSRLETLDVEIAVRGLTGSRVPDESLPATGIENDQDGEGGERFAWHYDALIVDRDVQVELPTRVSFVQRVKQLQAPLSRLSLASPFLVVLFVACLAGMHRLSGVRLPVHHYLLAGLGFFMFYPALTFLCGVVDLPLAAAVALVTVTALLTTFVGCAAGRRRTWRQTLLLCVVFLGLFSLGAMSPLRGLLFTTGGLLLVGTFMILVARQRASRPSETGETVETEEEPPTGEIPAADLELPEPPESEEEEQEEQPEADPSAPARHCPHCGAPLDEAFAFCPACGHDANQFRRCPACGSEHYVSPESELSYCPSCGAQLINTMDR